MPQSIDYLPSTDETGLAEKVPVEWATLMDNQLTSPSPVGTASLLFMDYARDPTYRNIHTHFIFTIAYIKQKNHLFKNLIFSWKQRLIISVNTRF